MKILWYCILCIVLMGCTPPLGQGLAMAQLLPDLQVDGETFPILAVGDTGSGSSIQRAVANDMIRETSLKSYKLVTFLGDNFYETGVASLSDPLWGHRYLDMYTSTMDLPIYAILGNHDWLGNPQAQVEYVDPTGRWTLPHYWYAQRIIFPDGGRTLLVFLDTTVLIQGGALAAEQRDWFHAIAGSLEHDRLMVFGHHPLVTSGAHQGDPDLEVLRGILKPIFMEHGASLYVSGHDHNLEVLKTDWGLTQVVSGSGGKIRGINTVPESQWAEASPGYFEITLTATDFTLVPHVVIVENP